MSIAWFFPSCFVTVRHWHGQGLGSVREIWSDLPGQACKLEPIEALELGHDVLAAVSRLLLEGSIGLLYLQ